MNKDLSNRCYKGKQAAVSIANGEFKDEPNMILVAQASIILLIDDLKARAENVEFELMQAKDDCRDIDKQVVDLLEINVDLFSQLHSLQEDNRILGEQNAALRREIEL